MKSSNGPFEPEDRDERIGEQIEAAIEGVRNSDANVQAVAAENLLPDDQYGQMLARVLGGLNSARSSADEPTRTESGSGASQSGSDQSGDVSQIGKYQILRRIGQGGMGTVYEAKDSFDPNAESIALKTIKPDYVAQDNAVERFVRELKSMARVKHDQVVPVLDSGAENGIPFFTMPLVKGEDFGRRIYHSENPPDLDELKIRTRVVEEVCRAVECIHEAGMLHRDIKPGNIFVGEHGNQSLLGDFGLAKLLDDESDCTKTNAILGSIRYASPEQLRGTTDVRSTAAPGLAWPSRGAWRACSAVTFRYKASPKKDRPSRCRCRWRRRAAPLPTSGRRSMTLRTRRAATRWRAPNPLWHTKETLNRLVSNQRLFCNPLDRFTLRARVRVAGTDPAFFQNRRIAADPHNRGPCRNSCPPHPQTSHRCRYSSSMTTKPTAIRWRGA